MTLRERATDRFHVVHRVTGGAWNNVNTRCGLKAKWLDRVVGEFSHNVMTWDGFNPLPDVDCMACLVAEANQ